MLHLILSILLVAAAVDSSEIEEYLSSCKREGFSSDFCLQNFANSVQPKAKQSLEEYGLPSLGPFEIPKLNLSQDGDGLSVSLQMYNFALHNFSDYQALNWQQDNGKVTVQARFPNVVLTTFYELEGTFLNQLIKGRGFVQIDFSPIHMDVTIYYKTFMKTGVKYCRILKVDANATIDDVYFHFEGLHRDSKKIIIHIFLSAAVDSHDIDGYLAGCKRQRVSRDMCMQNYINSIQPRANEGLPEMGLPSLGPFEIPKLNLSHISENLTATVQFFNFALHNFSNYQAINWEQGNGKIIGEAIFRDVMLTSFYDLDGTFFRQLFKGRGFVQANFSPIHLKVTIYYNAFYKSSVKYCKVLKVDVNANIDNVYLNFEGLDKDSVQNEYLNYHSQFLASHAAKAFAKLFEVYFGKQDYLSDCRRQMLSRDKCMQNYLNSIQPRANVGVPELGLPSLGPFEIPKLNLSHITENVTISVQLFNFVLHNLSNFQAIDWEQGDGKVTGSAVFRDVMLTSFYDLNGTFFKKLFKGRGFVQLNFSPIYLKVTIYYNTFYRSSVKYCKILKVDVNANIDNILFNFEGLDKDSVQNEFLNYHSQFLTSHAATSFAKVFQVYFEKLYDMCVDDYLSGCKRQMLSRDVCTQNYVNSIQPRANEGLPEMGLPSLGPFEITKLNLSHTSENVTVIVQLINFALHNFSNYQAINWEQGKGKVTGEGIFRNVMLTAFYELDGSLFKQLFKGRGFVQAFFSPIHLKATFYYNTFYKSSVKYCKILKVDVNANIDDIFFNFDGLDKDSNISLFILMFICKSL
ncbi:hypothetical protein FQR65_LT08327 [Abscondita terminalis]|nr:hypothetical protein FQR65_LT08327 [Abscondita terminalis]